jgi:hypothetical protein
MPEPTLTPGQLADLDQAHDEAQEDLDDLIEAHRATLPHYGVVLATAGLALELADQDHDFAAGIAAHALTRLVQVLAERDDALQALTDLRPHVGEADMPAG